MTLIIDLNEHNPDWLAQWREQKKAEKDAELQEKIKAIRERNARAYRARIRSGELRPKRKLPY